MWGGGGDSCQHYPPYMVRLMHSRFLFLQLYPFIDLAHIHSWNEKQKTHHHISCDFLFLSYIHAAESCTLIFSCTCEKGSPSLLTFLLDGKVTDWKKQLSPIPWSYTRWYFSVLFPDFKASILLEKIKRNKTDPKEAAWAATQPRRE